MLVNKPYQSPRIDVPSSDATGVLNVFYLPSLTHLRLSAIRQKFISR